MSVSIEKIIGRRVKNLIDKSNVMSSDEEIGVAMIGIVEDAINYILGKQMAEASKKALDKSNASFQERMLDGD